MILMICICSHSSCFPLLLTVCSDPMRITKKFAGSSCIGKQVFIPRDGPIDEKELAEIQDDLKVLEKSFMSKIDCQHRQQSYQMAGLAGSQGAVIAAALQSQASAAMGLSMPSPYMNSSMDMGLSASNHGNNYPPELLAAFHPHHAPTMTMPLPMHPMLANAGGGGGPPGGPSLAGYPNMYYAFPPPSHAHHPQQQQQQQQQQHPSMGSRKGSRKGSSSSDSSDSGPDANSAYHMAMHANEAAIREMKANLPTGAGNGASRQPSNNSNSAMNNSSSSSSSSSNGMSTGSGGGAPIYRSRQSYTSAELFGRQYPTTLEHMAFLSSENLEASRKKRSSDGSNVLSGISQQHVQVGPHKSHQKGSSLSKGKKGSTGRILPADPIDLDASSLLLNFFQSTATVPEENKSDTTSTGTSSQEVTFASGVDNSKNQNEHDGEGGDIPDEHKRKKSKIEGPSMGALADEKAQPLAATGTDIVLPDKQEAPSTSTSDGKLNGSRGKYKSSTSSGSGRTSNGSGTGSGDGDNDDSASTFSDAGDADASASNSISGRSSSLSSDRSDNSDYSSPDEKEHKNQQRNRIGYEEKPKPISSLVEVDLESRSRMVQMGGDSMNETTEQQQ